ncbi:hypothetical protein PI126_g10242 [Phytophthora idaei]|nr:hypothetical protein PI126_g10242 [Phytophthora idaei]
METRQAWKGIAGRQRKRRESAQRENSRLRIIEEKQRKIAVDLTALLRKRVTECGEALRERRHLRESSKEP